MKIIKQGKIPTLEIKCRKCESVLEIEGGDLKKHEACDYRGDINFEYHVICPVCQQQIDISYTNATKLL